MVTHLTPASRRRPRFFDSVFVVAVALIVVPTLSLDAQSSPATPGRAKRTAAPSWAQFRGGTAQGRVERTLPTRWTADEGIRWKTPLPGHGYSSPIVFGDRIYVTTADVAVSGLWLDTMLRYSTLGLTMILGVLVMVRLTGQCHPARSPTTRDFLAASGLAAAILVLAVIDGAGDALFDFARCNIRGWMTSTVFATVCLGLIAASTNHAHWRVTIAVIATMFAMFVLVLFPSKDFAFRGGISSLRMQMSIAASTLPLLTGAAIVVAGRHRAISMSAQRLAAAAVAVILIVIGALLIWHLIVFRDGAFPEKPYEPQVSPWWLLMPVAAITLNWLRCRVRASSIIVNMGIAWLGGASIVLMSLICVECLATRSFYLAYQIGEPRLELALSRSALWTAAAVFLAATLWILYRACASDSVATSATWLRRRWVMFGLTALTLATVHFMRVNYVSTAMWMFRSIVSLDRHSGRVLWTLRGLEGPQPPTDGRNSPATPTPATDGSVVCAYFGNPGLMCADADGRLAWSRTDIGYEGFYGAAFSLVLAGDLLIVANDRPDGQAQVEALDVTTGATRWATTFQTIPRVTGNNRTPMVRYVEGDEVVILWGLSYVKGLSLRSGQPVWNYPLASDGDLVSSAIMDNERLYLADHAGTTALDHASLTAGRDAILWKGAARANCASPVLAQGMIFTVTDGGVAAAQHAETGEMLWRHRLPGHYFASLVASPSAVYFTNSDGVTSVVAAEPKFRLIAMNDLDDEVIASMASADGELYIRTSRHLYAVTGADRRSSTSTFSTIP